MVKSIGELSPKQRTDLGLLLIDIEHKERELERAKTRTAKRFEEITGQTPKQGQMSPSYLRYRMKVMGFIYV